MSEQNSFNANRRKFIGKGFKIAILSSAVGASLLQACKEKGGKDDDDKKVSAPEDLMLKNLLKIFKNI